MIPKNKRYLIVNKEYSRLPYWTDEGYDDVQRQVSQKYVQDSFGKFAESENQPPYLSDADYQGLEYNYQDPQFPDIPEAGLINTKPSGFCEGLWDSLFGDRHGVFIPTASEWVKLNEYAKKCPLLYVPHVCCIGMKINGPGQVAPSAEAEYSSSGGGAGCAYTMKAKRGKFVGSTYTAPSTAGSDELYVTPWMSDDQGKKCAKKDILITGGCLGKIGPVIPQMEVSETQTLTVTGGSAYEDYYWSTTAGTIVPSEGLSVTFTAPATNANCTNNATVTLTCGGATVDTVHIAINANTADFTAYRTVVEVLTGVCCTWSEYFPCNETTCTGDGCGRTSTVTCTQYDCSGVMRTFSVWNLTCTHNVCVKLVGDTNYGFCTTPDYYYCGGNPGTYDMRTAAQKTAGCCPSAFI